MDLTLDSGNFLAREHKWKHPLMFCYHEKYYFGAKPGMAGILYMLLTVKEPSLEKKIDDLVKRTVDYMMSLQFSSGNCPMAMCWEVKKLKRPGDKVVRWSHGAPGWIYMFIEAHKRNPKNNNKTDYLEAAERCAEVIWKRGILHCGYGLSDGTAGNAYAFLAMYKLTKKNLYLHRAIKFAEWCCDFGKHDCPNPEFPCSLFEGLAGAIYFLSDILNPETACFPAFELT